MIYDEEWIEKPITFYTDNQESVKLKLVASRYKYPNRVRIMNAILIIGVILVSVIALLG